MWSSKNQAYALLEVALVLALFQPSAGQAQSGADDVADPRHEAPGTAPSNSDAVSSAAVSFAAVDAAVVRVFAVGSVSTLEVDGLQVRREVALPALGHGSGTLIDSDGHVLTAQHVIAGAHAVAVRLPHDPRVFPAVVVFEDADLDVAVLRIPRGHGRPARLAEAANLQVRETVHAIGYPLDPSRREPQSSRGIIAGVLPNGELQLDMSLNPGNSGGPLIDSENRVVGMVVARGAVDRGIQGIGVAVNLANLRHALASASEPDWSVPGAQRGVAQLVGLLVQLGPIGVVDDVLDDFRREPVLLMRLRGLAARLENPDLMVVSAALLWDAALFVLESQAGAFEPEHIADADARARATSLVDEARALCRRAVELDASVVDRSPFARSIQHRGTAVALLRRGPAGVVGTTNLRPRTNVRFDGSPDEVMLHILHPVSATPTRNQERQMSRRLRHAGTGSFEALCIAPCEARVPIGPTSFALSLGDRGPLRTGTVTVPERGGVLRGEFHSRRATRLSSILVFLAGLPAGSFLMVDEVLSVDVDTAYGPRFYAGMGTVALTLLVGTLMALRSDSAELRYSVD